MAENSANNLKFPHVGRSVSVRVPGTSANLGPGFDSLGLAVSLYDYLSVTVLAPDAELEFDLHGEGVEELPRDESHLVVLAMDKAFARLGYSRGGMLIKANNVLPHGRGLGSSASAIVAAILAANALVDPEDAKDQQWVLQLASEMEGHPDNVAPAIFGAVAISWNDDGGYSTARVTPHERIIPVVAIPNYEVKTELARKLLPATVAHAEAAANAGRTALLIHALKDAPELLLAGTKDYLHQDFRAEAMPASHSAVDRLRAAGIPAFISGAGPTVMVLARGELEAARVEGVIAESATSGQDAPTASVGEKNTPNGVSWRLLRLAVDLDGAKVELQTGT